MSKARQEKALMLIRDSGKTNYQIAKDTGISEATIGNYVNGKTKPTPANANILIAQLSGKGRMLNPFDEIEQDDIVYVPLLPIAAQGGSLNDFVVSVKDSDCERVVSPVRGADFAITVSGDSMAPEYPSGSQIIIKKINERAFIKWGEAYVLDTCNGTVIKLIVPSEREGYIKCVSINSNPKYAPFEVSFEDIYGIYRVLMCMAVK